MNIQLFFIMRGTLVPRIKGQVLSTVGVAVLVTMAHGALFNQKVTLTPIPFRLVGLALAIFLGFRNTASYVSEVRNSATSECFL
jgi:ion channel-forming bestrophin family protein